MGTIAKLSEMFAKIYTKKEPKKMRDIDIIDNALWITVAYVFGSDKAIIVIIIVIKNILRAMIINHSQLIEIHSEGTYRVVVSATILVIYILNYLGFTFVFKVIQ